MFAWDSSVLGPHPKYAIVPVLAVLAVVGWVAAKNPGPVEVPAGTWVTAMKPVEGSDTAPPSPELPIEVRYGVPTEKTLHLWPESKRAQK
jgi:hypothetical protein